MPTIESNKLIAVFMGATIEQWYPENKVEGMTGMHVVYPKDLYPANEKHHHESMLQYHSSWDWLMPVVHEIEKGLFAVAIKENECFITGYRKYEHIHFFFKESNTTKIQATYNTIIQFITWYNQQPK